MKFTDQQLRAYLDESLPADKMSDVEQALRGSTEVRERLAELVGMREAGVHALGDIWRRGRLTCPTRQDLGGYILGTLDEHLADYLKFHIETVGCRLCSANLEDLKSQHQGVSEQAQSRRRRYFQTSAGYLRKSSGE